MAIQKNEYINMWIEIPAWAGKEGFKEKNASKLAPNQLIVVNIIR